MNLGSSAAIQGTLRAGLAAALLALTAALPLAHADAEAPYALDALPRELPKGEPFGCPEVDLVDYKGTVVRFSSRVLVFKDFAPHLARFEEVARDVGIEIYGRPPSRIVHLGGFVCRRMTAYPNWLSEHGLGNAIDVSGFDFGPLPKDSQLPEGLPKGFKAGFEVRVERHWARKQGHAAVHARFLRTLADRLVARKDVFRVLLGPGYPAHDNHFHFDMSPFRMVEIYEDGKRIDAP